MQHSILPPQQGDYTIAHAKRFSAHAKNGLLEISSLVCANGNLLYEFGSLHPITQMDVSLPAKH
jgi:hypothetical protein